jgi:Gpi18-like mannosyltransferase
MKFIQKRPLLFLSFALFILSIFIRYQIIGLSNGDMLIFERWYHRIYRLGIAGLASEKFSNYPPLYLYLLWIIRTQSNWLGASVGIKLIPTAFDFLSAFAIFLMARIKFSDDKPYLYAAIFFTLPTILFNSTGWGQIESLFTSFLLLCTYFLLKEKSIYALIMFGFAFAVKSQSIFLLPFLGILFLKGRIRWYHFLLVPTTYIILAIPTAMLGRSWSSILQIYIRQVGQSRILSLNAPNLYIFVSNNYSKIGMLIGMVIFLIAMAAWGWVNWRAKITFNHRQIILMALASLALVPFVLPKMHDRYFYPVDAFSYAAIIFVPEMWFIPILYQLISSMSYSVFILNEPITLVIIAAIINTGTTIFILRKQFQSLKENLTEAQ